MSGKRLLLVMIDDWILRMGVVLPLPHIVLDVGRVLNPPVQFYEKMLQDSVKWIKNTYSRKSHFYQHKCPEMN